MKKIFAAVAVTALVLALAAPAIADDSGVGAYQGTASVGQSFDNPSTPLVQEGCGASGVPDAGVFGNGLRFPDPASVGGINGVWVLGTTVTGLPTGGALNICGELGQNVAGVGASCGMSEGKDGRGTFAGTYTLSDVGWVTSAGGTLPVLGTWTNPSNGHTGTLAALTQAQGGTDCATATGAKSFTVVGVTALA